MKSEIFTKNVKEWPIEILNVNRKCPIIKILILITEKPQKKSRKMFTYVCKLSVHRITRKCSLGKEIVFRLKIIGDTCLTPNEQFFSFIMAKTCYIRRNDDNIRFVID